MIRDIQRGLQEDWHQVSIRPDALVTEDPGAFLSTYQTDASKSIRHSATGPWRIS